MTDDIQLSDSNLPDCRADASRGDLKPRQTIRRSGGGSRPIDIAGARALDPIIQSAFGIVREGASLLYHIAGFGIAWVSGPQNSQPKSGTKPARPVAAECAKVIPFPAQQRRATVQRSLRNRS
jgi:hypothetical protein